MRVAMSYIFLPRATFDTTVKMISGGAGQPFNRSYINYGCTECEIYRNLRSRYYRAILVKSCSRGRSNLNAPVFDRVRD